MKSFGITMEEEFAQQVNDTLTRAKQTMVEAQLLEALMTYNEDPEEATALVKSQVDAMEEVEMDAAKDIHSFLWSRAQMIIRKQKIP